jgi:transcriptional regulator with XRE-family HTH domain
MCGMSTATHRIGAIVRDLRVALRWSQRDLSLRSGVSQPWVCAIERGRAPDITIATADRLLEAMGAQMTIQVAAPFLAESRQLDPAHARCAAHVARRLVKDGWQVATEVEVGSDRSRGWIDILAWHPDSGLLLVIEVKTELHDLGAIERTMNWYEREAPSAARRIGWRPGRVVGVLLVLSTDVVDQRIRENRDALDRVFPVRARELAALVGVGRTNATVPPGKALGLIDPRSRRQMWLRPTRVDGRRAPAPYADYIDFLRRITAA